MKTRELNLLKRLERTLKSKDREIKRLSKENKMLKNKLVKLDKKKNTHTVKVYHHTEYRQNMGVLSDYGF